MAAPPLCQPGTLPHIRQSICQRTENKNEKVQYTTIRGRLWQAFLYTSALHSTGTEYKGVYVKLCLLGAHSTKYEKIRVDSARTFPRDVAYNQCVDSKSLIRLLNAFTHQHNNTDKQHNVFTYIQGMNTLAATFLYVMPELDAYHMFNRLIVQYIPLYYQHSHIGVHAACTLIDMIIQQCDGELYQQLLVAHHLQAYIYAFSPVSSLCTSVLPLDIAVQIWDWLYAAQCPALNVVCVAAQILLIRQQLLSSKQPKALLDYRVWPQMPAADILQQSESIIETLNDTNPALLADIVHHATDMRIANRYTQRHHDHL